MVEVDINKCELIDCWFYIDHTPPKGQGDWGGTIHKGACKLNSTDCKDTPIEKCLIKSLYEQLKQSKSDNEELRSDNSMLLAQGDADAFVISNLNFKIQKLQQYIDEIEEIVNYSSVSYNNHKELADFYEDKIEEIIKLIKQAKGNNNDRF